MRLSSPLYQKLDEWIREGKIAEVRDRLAEFARGTPERGDRLALAQLLRRTDQPIESIRMLRPLVRKEGRRIGQATESEKAEYAASLARVGATDEALQLLSEINAESEPKALLYRAFAFLSDWRYADATIPLREYVGRADGYNRHVGLVNLLACHTFLEEQKDAAPLFAELESELGSTPSRLRTTLFELKVQWCVLLRDYPTGNRLLSEMGASPGTRQALFVEKWRAIIKLLTTGDLRSLEEVKKQAQMLSHFETIRQCDYFEAFVRKDVSLFLKLYFGTPYSAFREKVHPHLAEVPSEYLWRLGKDSRRIPELDRSTLSRVGRLPGRLFSALTCDFYRPQRLAALFSRVYPEDHFNPDHCAQRIHVAISELRKAFAKLRWPLIVNASDSNYRLTSQAPVGIWVTDHADPLEAQWRKLAAIQLTYSTNELSRYLGISARTVLRSIELATQRGWVVREGQGRLTRYRITLAPGPTYKVARP